MLPWVHYNINFKKIEMVANQVLNMNEVLNMYEAGTKVQMLILINHTKPNEDIN